MRLARLPAAVAVALVSGLVASNAYWLVVAGRSIATPGDPLKQLMSHLAGSGAPPCYLSPRVRSEAKRRRLPAAHCAVEQIAGSGWTAFYASEVRAINRWTANRHDYTIAWFGPREVNFNYYPSWGGSDRIVLMRSGVARALGIGQAPSGRELRRQDDPDRDR